MPAIQRNKVSLWLCRYGMILYIIWLLIPSFQSALGGIFGALACSAVALGIALDFSEWKKNPWLMLLQFLSAGIVPLILYFYVGRGDQFLGFYARFFMLCMSIFFCSYARRKGDPALWKNMKILIFATMVITTLTTIGWLIQWHMTPDMGEHTYSRMLGRDVTERKYARTLMLWNIGGYDFIYGSVISIPFICIGIQTCKGKRKLAFLLLLIAQIAMIVMSEYTYALVYTCCLLFIELLALLLRKLFKLKMGMSFLLTLIPIVLLVIFREPVLRFAIGLTEQMGLEMIAGNLERLLKMFEGTLKGKGNRMYFYNIAIKGFLESPVIGSVFSAEKQLSRHSEILDLLSGTGIVGTLLFLGMMAVLNWGLWKNARKSAHFPRLIMVGLLLLAEASFGTVFYSRDVFVVYSFGLLLTGYGEERAATLSPSNGEDSSDILQKATEQ